MIALVFKASGGRRLLIGAPQPVTLNLERLPEEDQVGVRLLDGTPLATLASLNDPRVLDDGEPVSLAAFDAAYPEAGRWPPET